MSYKTSPKRKKAPRKSTRTPAKSARTTRAAKAAKAARAAKTASASRSAAAAAAKAVQRSGVYLNDETKCPGLTAKNTRCKNGVPRGERFCKVHNRPRREHEDRHFDSNMSKVWGNMWIGSLDSANDERALREANIKSVMNISGWEPHADTRAMYKRLGIKYNTTTRNGRYLGDQPIGDGLTKEEFFNYMDRGVRMIENSPKYANGRPAPVLCHCFAGINRGGSLVAAWLIQKGFSFEEARRMLIKANDKRGIRVLSNHDFVMALRDYERTRRGLLKRR